MSSSSNSNDNNNSNKSPSSSPKLLESQPQSQSPQLLIKKETNERRPSSLSNVSLENNALSSSPSASSESLTPSSVPSTSRLSFPNNQQEHHNTQNQLQQLQQQVPITPSSLSLSSSTSSASSVTSNTRNRNNSSSTTRSGTMLPITEDYISQHTYSEVEDNENNTDMSEFETDEDESELDHTTVATPTATETITEAEAGSGSGSGQEINSQSIEAGNDTQYLNSNNNNNKNKKKYHHSRTHGYYNQNSDIEDEPESDDYEPYNYKHVDDDESTNSDDHHHFSQNIETDTIASEQNGGEHNQQRKLKAQHSFGSGINLPFKVFKHQKSHNNDGDEALDSNELNSSSSTRRSSTMSIGAGIRSISNYFPIPEFGTRSTKTRHSVSSVSSNSSAATATAASNRNTPSRSLSVSHINNMDIHQSRNHLQSAPTTALSFATGIPTNMSMGSVGGGSSEYNDLMIMDYENEQDEGNIGKNYSESNDIPGELGRISTAASVASTRRSSLRDSGQLSETLSRTGTISSTHNLISHSNSSTPSINSSSGLFSPFVRPASRGSIAGSRLASISITSPSTIGIESTSNSIDSPNSEGDAMTRSTESIYNQGRQRNVMSPIPTLSMEHNSDVATLLSEVLDSDLETRPISKSGQQDSGDHERSTLLSSSSLIGESSSAISSNENQELLDENGENLDLTRNTTHTDAGLEYPRSLSSALNESSDDDDDDDYDDFDDDNNNNNTHKNKKQPNLEITTNKDGEPLTEDEIRGAREEKELSEFLARKKQYFILSIAGKPIYSMYGSDELVTGYMGVFQAIVSYFEEEEENNRDTAPSSSASSSTHGSVNSRRGFPGNSNKNSNTGNNNKSNTAANHNPQKEGLRLIRAGNTMFVFALEYPLILIAVDKLGQTESQLRAQLDLLYAQILSTLTKSQLSKVFTGRSNFDLRPMLAGTEVFLNALTKEMSFGSPGILLGALECLRLRKSVRSKMHTILSERRTKSILYGIIVADSRLVAVIRPRRHSLHPPDLHLIFSMLFNTHSFSKGRGEHWVPICLPKFNATGFLYAYIHFFAPPQVALVLISADKNAFFELQAAKENIVEDLRTHDLITPILNSLKRGRYRTIEIFGTPHITTTTTAAAYAHTSDSHLSTSRVGSEGSGSSDIPHNVTTTISSSAMINSSILAPFTIRHFLYKSKQNVQFVMPSFDPHYLDNKARHKLMALYHQLHGALHSNGAGARPGNNLRVYHVSRGNNGMKGSALAWITPTFELYCVTGSAHEAIKLHHDNDNNNNNTAAATLVAANINNKDAMLRAVKNIVNWIKTHEERLFIFGGAVF